MGEISNPQRRGLRHWLAAVFCLGLGACGGGAPERQPAAGADPARGLVLVQQVGCGACHIIPGVTWPRGRVGPSLEGFAARSLIAGKLPNQPEPLAEFVRDATAFSPQGGMPPMPLTETEARDVAAYLLTLQPR
ncbi:c-type cytochrome [Phenylobacterium sp.]|uniref:c-type cytochrome n=1 Tax=Phenylobacterium sp. TaxID=1871053 RepID=UPI002FD97DA7